MKWFFAYASKYDFKSHIVPEVLYEKVRDSLYSRGCSRLVKKEITSMPLDLPGMIMTNRHEHDIEVSDLTLIIPATDVETFIYMLENLKERDEIGTKYYKLHGFQRCICLTLEQRDEFIHSLEQVLAEAAAIADVENELFNEKIAGSKNQYIKAKPRPVRKKKPEA